MNDRTLITTGVVGGTLAAICCATPLLAVVLGAAGLTAWLCKADYDRLGFRPRGRRGKG
jgi:mercuric ion transport protein